MSAFLKQFLFIFHKNELFWIKLILIKMKNYQQFKKKRGQPFAQQFFVKPCAKVQGKRASRSGTGPQGTSQSYSYLFRFKLTIKILLTLFLPFS